MRRSKRSQSRDEQRAIANEQRHVVDLDPEDPTQQLDEAGEFHIEPLDVEAMPAEEIDEDLDIASAENVEDEEAEPEVHKDTGELYGIRTPHAADREISAPEDRDSFEGSWRGETWLESLEEHAGEMGPAPEEEVVIVDDSDEHPGHRGHHPTEGGDRPVADKGSGGPGGV